MLSTIEIETSASPVFSVIWLHGLGADGSDFSPIVGELDLPKEFAVRFVFPHAPVQPVTLNGGYPMRAWYDIYDLSLERGEDAEGIGRSERAIGELIEREKERGVRAENIVLAGFSQGGAIALHSGLRFPERLGGIIALSTYLPLGDRLENEGHFANSGLPIFMAHGDQDDVIALRFAEQSRNALTSAGYGVEWHLYPMPHSVNDAEIADISSWLRRIFSARGNARG